MRSTEKVTVRPTKHADYPDGFVVRWPGAKGKRMAKLFTNEPEALTWAKERRAELGDVGESFGSMTEPERAAVTFWRGFLVTVPDAAPPALLAILQDYAVTWKANRSSVTVAAAVDAYEAAKTAEGLRPRSLQAIRTRCHRFVMDFGSRSISSITTAEISDWILSLPVLIRRGPVKSVKARKGAAPAQVGLLAKRNQRLGLSGLFNYAKTRGWVRENPVADAARPKPPKTRPEVLRPSDVARLFGALEKIAKGKNAPALIPFWAVRFFAGVREQEALRMDWSMIDLAGGEVHLPDTVTKTGHSRTVKIEPALAAFLAPYAKTDGPLVTPSAMARIYHLRKAWRILQAEDAAAIERGEEIRPFPVPMPANAARHSFATFHLLAFRHAGETALQLGHGGSPEMLHRHYKGIASEAEALAFWTIRPAAGPANVVSISGHTEKAATPKTKQKKAR